MISFFTIILFLAYAFGLGFTATFFVKNSENFLERNLIRLGIGLGVLPILGIFLSFLRIPLDWKIFLVLSLAFPCFHFFKNIKKIKVPQLKIKKSDVYIIIVFIIFLATFYMYHKGAFAYPYLEDDDPWSHAIGIKYVSIGKTVFIPSGIVNRFQYIDPYPPSYDLIMGVLHQTSSSIMWTMKFFNALIISLSIIFFYFFVEEFTNSKKKALFSTFALAMIPCFLSHFIWAIALNVPLYLVAFYCTEKIPKDKKWIFPSSLVIASSLTISPTHSVYFGFFFILYFITRSLLKKQFLHKLFLSGFLGFLISFLLWWLPVIFKNGFVGLIRKLGAGGSIISQLGTGDRLYTLNDFIFAQPQNMINNPIGIGLFLSLLALLFLISVAFKFKSLLEEKNHWIIVSLVWFVFTLYAVNGARFPVKLSPFRTWMLLAIPLCILASEGFFFLLSLLKNNMAKIILIVVVLGGVWFTSGYQKYTVNTTPGWPPGAFWASMEELQGYLWLKDLPVNTKVFSFVNDGVIIGFDKFTCAWCEEVINFKKEGLDKSAEELHSWLEKENYQYLIIGGQEAREFGVNMTNAKINEFISSNLFRPAHSNAGVVILEVT